LNVRYHRTHRTIISWSKCRPLKSSCAEAGSVIQAVTAGSRAFQVCTRTVGKTLSAKHYTRWSNFKNVVSWRQLSETALKSFEGHSTLFYYPSVANTARQIAFEISVARDNLRRLAIEPLRRDEERELEEIRTAERVGAYGWQSRAAGADSVYGRVAKAYAAREKAILDPTKLIVVDEADRLQMASLEQLRAIFDESDLGLILIGMPGLEKRLARYPQFYSRIGFVHEFRPLSQSEMRQLLLQRWMPPDLALLKVAKIDPDAIATIIRVINGNSATPPSANPNRKNPRDQFAHCTDEGGRRGSTGDVGNRPRTAGPNH
jgi:DNA transposition AAA+ family ATPase